jgi:hypothetical protein
MVTSSAPAWFTPANMSAQISAMSRSMAGTP